MPEIKLRSGARTVRTATGWATIQRVALVDERDYDSLNKYQWSLNRSGKGYAQRIDGGKHRKCILMHREILGCSDDQEVDHINGNTLDNRRENLRVCTRAQNSRNQSRHCNNRSGVKGVFLVADAVNRGHTRRWQAKIMVSGKQICLGRHRTKTGAAKAYEIAAKKFHGEFARFDSLRDSIP